MKRGNKEHTKYIKTGDGREYYKIRKARLLESYIIAPVVYRSYSLGITIHGDIIRLNNTLLLP